MSKHKTRLAAALLWALGAWLAPGLAAAADKALLIGVGEYADPRHDLPGIDIDLRIMHGVARQMGYAEENIRQLRHAQVTAESVTRAMREWLGRGVEADDRVLIYYSGHGSQVRDRDGDERDGYDEVLSLYNLAVGAADMVGVLRDDDFAALLAEIPSRRVTVVVDACCSGTAVRSHTLTRSAYGGTEFVVKSRGCRSTADAAGAGFATGQPLDGVVFLSAAQDGEESLATARGSLFTLALQQAVREGRHRSAEELLAATRQNLAQSVPASHRFRPNLIGDPALLADKGLFQASPSSTAAAPALGWQQWSSLVKLAEPLAVQPSRERYTIGQQLELELELPEAGYLNIVAVNPDDQVVVLFPNEFQPDNRVGEGQLQLPGEGYSWDAGEPLGDSLIVSLFSREPVNLFAGSHQRDAEGRARGVFLRPETADAEALRQLAQGEGNDAALRASALVLSVCENRDCNGQNQ